MCEGMYEHRSTRVAPHLYVLYAGDGDYLPANKNLRLKKHQTHLLGHKFSWM